MARSKKTVSQKVVGAATTGLPQPVKKLLGGRLVALLIVLCIPVLFATGIVSLKWEDGRPRLSINRQRAAEVKQEAGEKIEELRHEHRGDSTHGLGLIPQLGDQQKKPHVFSGDWQRPGTTEETVADRVAEFQENLGEWQPPKMSEGKVGERVAEIRENLGQNRGQSWSFGSGVDQQENAPKQEFRPLSRLKDKFEDLRR